MRMQKFKLKKLTLVLSLGTQVIIVGGCNSGTNTASSQPANAPTTITKTDARLHSQVIYSTNAESRPITMALSGETGESWIGSIGWNSTLQTIAPMNCYNYVVTLDSATAVAHTRIGASTSDFFDSFKFSASISEGDFDSAKMAVASSLAAFSSQATAISDATVKETVHFQPTSLNAVGQSYESKPQEFALQCGDTVLTQLPVFMDARTLISVNTANSQFKLDTSASGSGVTEDLSKVAAEIDNELAISSSAMNIYVSSRSTGGVDPNSWNEASQALGQCLDSSTKTANPQECSKGTAGLMDAVQTGNNTAAEQIKTGGDWSQYYAIDWSRSDEITFESPNIIPGWSGNPVEPTHQQYATTINSNMSVLKELAVIGEIIDQQVNPMLQDVFNNGQTVAGQSFTPTKFPQAWSATTAQFTPQDGANYAFSIAQNNLYSLGALTDIQNNNNNNNSVIGLYGQAIINCTRATTPTDVDNYCSALPTKPTIDSIIKTYYPMTTASQFAQNDPNFIPAVESGLLTTIHNLAYVVSINGLTTTANNNHNNNFFSSGAATGATYNGNIVSIPTSSTQGFILALPSSLPALSAESSPYHYVNGFCGTFGFGWLPTAPTISYGEYTSNPAPTSECNNGGGFPAGVGAWQGYNGTILKTFNNMAESEILPPPAPRNASSYTGNTIGGGYIAGDMGFSSISNTYAYLPLVWMAVLANPLGKTLYVSNGHSITTIVDNSKNSCDSSQFGINPNCSFQWQIEDWTAPSYNQTVTQEEYGPDLFVTANYNTDLVTELPDLKLK